jgi:hypothetical protein
LKTLYKLLHFPHFDLAILSIVLLLRHGLSLIKLEKDYPEGGNYPFNPEQPNQSRLTTFLVKLPKLMLNRYARDARDSNIFDIVDARTIGGSWYLITTTQVFGLRS